MIKDNERNRLIKAHADDMFKDKQTREKVGTLLHMANLEGYSEGSDNTRKFWNKAIKLHTIVIYGFGLFLGQLYDSLLQVLEGFLLFTAVYLVLSLIMDMGEKKGKLQAEMDK